MKNNKYLLKQLTSDIERLQYKIEHRCISNVRSFVARTLIKSGIAIDYALPFIISSVLAYNNLISEGYDPLHFDDVVVKAGIETIDTSSGVHIEHISFDFIYDNRLIEYSTGWIINDNNLYERTVTSYKLNDEINLNDTEKILSMTKEELEKILVVTNIETIKKNKLTPEDSIYISDAIIIVNYSETEDVTKIRQETMGENLWQILVWIFISLCWGRGLTIIERIFVKTYIRDRLRVCETSFRKINKEELETMKEILKLKKDNLELLNSEQNSIEHPYQLRKRGTTK